MISLNMKELNILSALISKDMYGLEIVRYVNEHGTVKLQLGNLYAILSGMEKKGVVTSDEAPTTSKRGGNKRRYYSLTAAGQRCINEYQLRLGGMWGFQIA